MILPPASQDAQITALLPYGHRQTLTLILPTASSVPPITALPTALRGPRGTETVLVAEDESAVRQVLCLALERHGYKVLKAADGPEALLVWETHKGHVDLLLTDQVMPGGLSGRELADRMRASQPSLKVLFMSGYSTELSDYAVRPEDGEVFVQKPFSPRQLLTTLRACLDR